MRSTRKRGHLIIKGPRRSEMWKMEKQALVQIYKENGYKLKAADCAGEKTERTTPPGKAIKEMSRRLDSTIAEKQRKLVDEQI